jgi:hypothetical protein
LKTFVSTPVFASFDQTAPIVGHYFAVVPWSIYLAGELAAGTPTVHFVVESSCGHVLTFEINGPNVSLISSNDDEHDSQYDENYILGEIGAFAFGSCKYSVAVYPTVEYEQQYMSNSPIVYMSIVLLIFVVTTLAFLAFDYLVASKQKELVVTARKQNALVATLFPVSSPWCQ